MMMLRYEFTLGIYTPTSREYIRIYTPREGIGNYSEVDSFEREELC